MPNRKTFDEREKYDHSAHSTRHREPGDLASPAGGDSKPDQPRAEKGNMPAKPSQVRTARSR